MWIKHSYPRFEEGAVLRETGVQSPQGELGNLEGDHLRAWCEVGPLWGGGLCTCLRAVQQLVMLVCAGGREDLELKLALKSIFTFIKKLKWSDCWQHSGSPSWLSSSTAERFQCICTCKAGKFFLMQGNLWKKLWRKLFLPGLPHRVSPYTSISFGWLILFPFGMWIHRSLWLYAFSSSSVAQSQWISCIMN